MTGIGKTLPRTGFQQLQTLDWVGPRYRPLCPNLSTLGNTNTPPPGRPRPCPFVQAALLCLLYAQQQTFWWPAPPGFIPPCSSRLLFQTEVKFRCDNSRRPFLIPLSHRRSHTTWANAILPMFLQLCLAVVDWLFISFPPGLESRDSGLFLISVYSTCVAYPGYSLLNEWRKACSCSFMSCLAINIQH